MQGRTRLATSQASPPIAPELHHLLKALLEARNSIVDEDLFLLCQEEAIDLGEYDIITRANGSIDIPFRSRQRLRISLENPIVNPNTSCNLDLIATTLRLLLCRRFLQTRTESAQRPPPLANFQTPRSRPTILAPLVTIMQYHLQRERLVHLLNDWARVLSAAGLILTHCDKPLAKSGDEKGDIYNCLVQTLSSSKVEIPPLQHVKETRDGVVGSNVEVHIRPAPMPSLSSQYVIPSSYSLAVFRHDVVSEQLALFEASLGKVLERSIYQCISTDLSTWQTAEYDANHDCLSYYDATRKRRDTIQIRLSRTRLTVARQIYITGGSLQKAYHVWTPPESEEAETQRSLMTTLQ